MPSRTPASQRDVEQVSVSLPMPLVKRLRSFARANGLMARNGGHNLHAAVGILLTAALDHPESAEAITFVYWRVRADVQHRLTEVFQEMGRYLVTTLDELKAQTPEV